MKRLLEGPLSARANTLLRSAASDVPPKAAEEKARLLTAVSATVAARQARNGMLSGKWLGLLSAIFITGGIAGTGYYGLRAANTSESIADGESNSAAKTVVGGESNTAAKALAVAENAASAATTNAPQQPEAIDVSNLPTASPVEAARAKPPTALAASSAEHRAQPTASSAPSAKAQTANAEPRLEDELAAVDEARAAFVDHQPALALSRVESYRRRFPTGNFTTETDALEIQALAALQRNDEARSKAARFIAQHPESPYAQRVRSAVAAKP